MPYCHYIHNTHQRGYIGLTWGLCRANGGFLDGPAFTAAADSWRARLLGLAGDGWLDRPLFSEVCSGAVFLRTLGSGVRPELAETGQVFFISSSLRLAASASKKNVVAAATIQLYYDMTQITLFWKLLIFLCHILYDSIVSKVSYLEETRENRQPYHIQLWMRSLEKLGSRHRSITFLLLC